MSLERLARLPEVVALSAASSLTDQLAANVLSATSGSSSVFEHLRQLGLTVDAGDEWRVDPRLRQMSIGLANRTRPWNDAHQYYSEISAGASGDELPAYMRTGPGFAYHRSEIDLHEGVIAYGAIAHIDSLAVSFEASKLADEQSQRGLLDLNDTTFVFLRGMTLYRMGSRSEAIRLLRRVAERSEQTREVAVAQHLVGHWDCLRNNRGDAVEAQRMLKKSHGNAAKRQDQQHLAHVKHSMALCILRSKPSDRAKAVTLLRESLTIASSIEDEWGRAKVLHSLGQALGKESRTRPQAIRAFSESMAIGSRLGYSRHVRSVQESIDRLGKRSTGSPSAQFPRTRKPLR